MTKHPDEILRRYLANRSVSLRNDLVEHYAHLVPMTYTRLRAKFLLLPKWGYSDDYCQYGFLGLIDAIEKFKPTRTGRQLHRLRNFAISKITWAMQEYDREEKVRTLVDAKSYLRAAYDLYVSQTRGQIPTEEELAQFLDCDSLLLSRISDFFRDGYERNILMSDKCQLLSCEEFGLDYYDILPGSSNTLKSAVKDLAKAELEQIISQLSPRRQKVLMMFRQGYYFKEIGRELKCSESRAHQIYEEAIECIRGSICSTWQFPDFFQAEDHFEPYPIADGFYTFIGIVRKKKQQLEKEKKHN